MARASATRVALVTIGQTPRDDLVPEIVRWSGDAVEAVEYGALDGLGGDEIGALAPAGGQHRLVTRLRDGSQAVVAKERIAERLERLFRRLRPGGHDAVVLLCTGHFDGLHPPPGIFLEAQRLVDDAVAAFAAGAGSIGVMVPLARQMDEFHYAPREGQVVRMAHASPYDGDRLAEAGRELAGADLIVMHCMGYTESMRDTVVEAAGKPVLLARRVVGAAVAQLA